MECILRLAPKIRVVVTTTEAPSAKKFCEENTPESLGPRSGPATFPRDSRVLLFSTLGTRPTKIDRESLLQSLKTTPELRQIVDRRNGLYLAVSAISTSLLLSVELHSPWSSPNLYSDIVDSFWPRDWVQAGSLPYLTAYFEYPPISGLAVYLARAIGVNLLGFYATFSAVSLIAGAVVAWSCWRIAKSLGRELNSLFFMLPSFLIYGVYNFDLFHVAFVVLSLQSLISKRVDLSAFFLGLGVATKLTSIVLLPVFLMEVQGKSARFRYAGEFLAVAGAFNLSFALLNYSSFLQGYQFLASYGLEDAWYVWIFQDSSTWNLAKVFGAVVSVVLLLRVYTMKASLVARSFLAIAAFLLGTYIYAPQFNLLLLPFVAVLDLQHPATYLWDGFNALIILTWFLQPNSTMAWTWPQFFALLRAFCLAWLCLALLTREGWSLMNWLRALLTRPQGTTRPPPRI